MRISFVLLAALCAALSALVGSPARCDTPSERVTIDFEALASGGLVAGPGKNSNAVASVSGDAAHGGTRAGKVVYSFSGNGYIEFQLASPVLVSQTSDPVDCTVWVKGAGKRDFGNVALRFLDAKGNVFQYRAEGLADKFSGDGWSRFQIKLDPLKFQETWGPTADKQLKPPLRFFGLGADHFENGTASGTVFVDDISVQPVGSASATFIPSVTVTSDHKLLVIRPGESVTFNAAFTGAVPDFASTFQYRWQMHDFDGKLIANTPDSTTLPGSAPNPYTVHPAQPGFYYVTCEFVDSAGGVISDSRSSLVATASPGPPIVAQWPFLVGMNTHLERWSAADQLMQIEIMRLAGIKIVRDGPSWGGLEPAPGVWRWEKFDRDVDALRDAGIQLQYGLAYSAKWASTGNASSRDWHDWNNAPPVTEKFVAYAQAAVNRYKGSVHYWEVWNEPDLTFWLGTADQYAQLLSASIKGIHEADPTAKVLNGGISEVNFRPGFPSDFLAKADPKPDIFAYHTHGPLSNLPIARAKVDGYLAKTGMTSKPVWLNEAGIPSVGGCTLREQAITLVKKIASSEAMGDQAYLLYDLIDDGPDPVDPEDHFGIVFHDFAPKPALAAVHTLIECLGGKAFSGKLPAEIGQTVYCYRDRLETTAALWSDRPDVTDSVLVRCDAKSAILTDMMGRTTSLKPVAGCYTIPISYEPAFFNAIGKRASIELVKSIIDAPSATLPEGELSAYEVKVENPLAVRLTGSLTFQSDTIKSSVSTLNVDVAPGKTQALPLRLQIAPGAGAMHILHVRFEPSANLPTIEKDVRLRTAVKLPFLIASESTEDRPPLVTLDPRKNLVSLYTATPMESLKFHGPADLSAKAWIWQSTEGIRVRVVVTDDVHFQREQPGSYWKGDSMQFALIGPSDKLLEWTTALTGDGPRIERSVWPSEWAGVPVSERVRVTRVGTLTTYDITIPSVIPEIGKSIEYGCRMSLLVNDNDGAGRKGWLEWTPGIGVTKDPTSFVPIAFAKP